MIITAAEDRIALAGRYTLTVLYLLLLLVMILVNYFTIRIKENYYLKGR